MTRELCVILSLYCQTNRRELHNFGVVFLYMSCFANSNKEQEQPSDDNEKIKLI